ncbi:myo-inositol transporter, partial [Dissophora ornata]
MTTNGQYDSTTPSILNGARGRANNISHASNSSMDTGSSIGSSYNTGNSKDKKRVSDIAADVEDNSSSKFLYVLITCLAIGGFIFGYDAGVITGALLPIKEEFSLTSHVQEFVVGGQWSTVMTVIARKRPPSHFHEIQAKGTTLGAILDGLLAEALSNLLGRKSLTLLSSSIFVIGAALMTYAHQYWLFLFFGRVVVE